MALALALLPLSRAEVDGVFSDVRVLAVGVDASALAGRDDLAGAGLACCVPERAETLSAVVAFADALPLPVRGAFTVAFSAASVALALAIGTLTFTRTGEKDFAIQTGYCSTSLTTGFPAGEDFVWKIKA
ncbi:hypothetical protein K6V06_05560 [Cupriavidus sp. AU9028]|nr:hypothetical protein [Cupriavidus sp. AU9028]